MQAAALVQLSNQFMHVDLGKLSKQRIQLLSGEPIFGVCKLDRRMEQVNTRVRDKLDVDLARDDCVAISDQDEDFVRAVPDNTNLQVEFVLPTVGIAVRILFAI